MGRRSVINRENMCKGPVAGRNLAHPASHSRKSKVYVTGAQEQEVEWYKTKARGVRRPDTNSSDWGDNVIYHPNCYSFECAKILVGIVCWHYV